MPSRSQHPPPTPPCCACTQDKVRDRLGLMTAEGQLLQQLGRSQDAAQLYRQLLASNPDNYDYHRWGLLTTKKRHSCGVVAACSPNHC